MMLESDGCFITQEYSTSTALLLCTTKQKRLFQDYSVLPLPRTAKYETVFNSLFYHMTISLLGNTPHFIGNMPHKFPLILGPKKEKILRHIKASLKKLISARKRKQYFAKMQKYFSKHNTSLFQHKNTLSGYKGTL